MSDDDRWIKAQRKLVVRQSREASQRLAGLSRESDNDALEEVLDELDDLQHLRLWLDDFERVLGGGALGVIFELYRRLEEHGQLIAARAEAQGLSFDLHYAPSLPRYVNTDPSLLQTIMLALADLAFASAESGHLRFVCALQGRRRLRLSMSVTRPVAGIYQQRPSASLLSRLVQSLGGEFAHRENGQGLLVSAAIPVRVEDSVVFPVSEAYQHSSLEVALVTRDAIQTERFRLWGALCGVEISVFDSFEAVLRRLTRQTCDLLLFDQRLETLTEELYKALTARPYPPILVRLDDAHRLSRDDRVECYTRPLMPSQFFTLLVDAWERQSLNSLRPALHHREPGPARERFLSAAEHQPRSMAHEASASVLYDS